MSTLFTVVSGAPRLVCRGVLAGAVALLAFTLPAHAQRSVDEKASADPQGEVEVLNLAGDIEVSGWDKPEVGVTGTVDNDSDKVELTTSGSRTSVRVVPHGIGSHHGDAHLAIHVPARGAFSATLVNADLKLHGLIGTVKVQSISGDVGGDVGADVKVTTVSGNVTLAAPQSHSIEIRTISGDIKVSGGTDEVEVSTVSGKAILELATISRGRFKSVSGDFTIRVALAPDARLEGESVSGDLTFNFAGEPAGSTDVQTFSGSIENCFGPKPVESRYGPGSRLSFKNGDGRGQIHIDTKSGDVKLCVQGAGGRGDGGPGASGHTHGPVTPT